MSHIIEEQFEHENHQCVVLFTQMGHRCGYVAVTEDSPLYGKHYHDDLEKPELLKELEQTSIGKRGILPVFCWDGEKVSPESLFNVHGGITFADGRDNYPVQTDQPLWWFGFDCGHYGDAPDLAALRECFGEGAYHNKLRYIFELNGLVRTKEYVIKECKSLAEQIACVESTY